MPIKVCVQMTFFTVLLSLWKLPYVFKMICPLLILSYYEKIISNHNLEQVSTTWNHQGICQPFPAPKCFASLMFQTAAPIISYL